MYVCMYLSMRLDFIYTTYSMLQGLFCQVSVGRLRLIGRVGIPLHLHFHLFHADSNGLILYTLNNIWRLE